MSRILIIKGAE